MEKTTPAAIVGLTLAIALMLALWTAVSYAQGPANEPDERVAAQIAAQFTRLAGSEENALALVGALRSGDMVRLVAVTHGMEVPDVTAFETGTGAMEWKAVTASLTRAQVSLAHAGIRTPTPEQLQAALLGGEITVPSGGLVMLPSVLP